MNGFLPKPLSLEVLRQVMAELVPKGAPREVRVLVLDDDSMVRHSTARLLRAQGFLVDEAADTATASAQLANAAPHCVLIDRVLGGSEDGVDFALRLRSAHPALRVIVTSGNEPTEGQRHALRAAGAEFLAKPYTVVELLRHVGETAEARRAG
jgi:DNA-binding response OmpR family regulator